MHVGWLPEPQCFLFHILSSSPAETKTASPISHQGRPDITVCLQVSLLLCECREGKAWVSFLDGLSPAPGPEQCRGSVNVGWMNEGPSLSLSGDKGVKRGASQLPGTPLG